MPIDTGSYGWKFRKDAQDTWHLEKCQVPGFVKRYLRRCRRIEKVHAHRQNRYEAKRELRETT